MLLTRLEGTKSLNNIDLLLSIIKIRNRIFYPLHGRGTASKNCANSSAKEDAWFSTASLLFKWRLPIFLIWLQ